MMMPNKEKVITGFKVLSILLISLMLFDLYTTFNKEEITHLKIKKEKEIQTQSKIFQIYQTKIYSFSENDSNKTAEFSTNSYAYYSFAIILGAFINAKKIMKIGVI